jgi:hypothetical protein
MLEKFFGKSGPPARPATVPDPKTVKHKKLKGQAKKTKIDASDEITTAVASAEEKVAASKAAGIAKKKAGQQTKEAQQVAEVAAHDAAKKAEIMQPPMLGAFAEGKVSREAYVKAMADPLTEVLENERLVHAYMQKNAAGLRPGSAEHERVLSNFYSTPAWKLHRQMALEGAESAEGALSRRAMDDVAESLKNNGLKSFDEIDKGVEATLSESMSSLPERLAGRESMSAMVEEGEKRITRRIDEVLHEATGRKIEGGRISALETAERRIDDLLGKATGKARKELLDAKKTLRSEIDSQRSGVARILGVAGMGAIGVTALSSIFTPSEAEAAGIPAGAVVQKAAIKFLADAKNIAPKEVPSLVAEMFETGLAIPALEEGAKVLPRAMEQVPVAAIAREKYGKMSEWFRRTKELPLSAQRYMSPYTVGDLFYKGLANAAVQLGSAQTAIHHGTDMAWKVGVNILRKVPNALKIHEDDVIKAMEPWIKNFSTEMRTYQALDAKMTALKKAEESISSSIAKPKKGQDAAKLQRALDNTRKEQAKIEKGMESLRQKALVDAPAEYEKVVRPLAEANPRVRMALAMEPKKYPWALEMVKKNPEELEALGYFKENYAHYTQRMKDVKHTTIDGDYIHHAVSPKMRESMVADRLRELNLQEAVGSLPYHKFHKRADFSVQWVPDISYSWRRYAPDAERRIHMKKFWDDWKRHADSPYVQGNVALRDFWQDIKTVTGPQNITPADRLINNYYSLEVARLLALNVGAGFKHLFKIFGTYAQLGPVFAAKHAPGAAATAIRNSVNEGDLKQVLTMLGVKGGKMQKQVTDDVVRSMIHQGTHLHILHELNILPTNMNKFERYLHGFNRGTGFFIRGTESFDRAHTVLSSLDMAAKQGKTAYQAAYGIYDGILKNNFLGGMLNSRTWRDPKFRTLFMFQSTPFKILERRLVGAIKTKDSVKAAWGVVKNQDIGKTLTEMKDLKRYMKRCEHQFKHNMIADALFGQRDTFNNPYTTAFMRELLLMGAVIGGGGVLFDMDFHPHMAHLPFIRHGFKDPTLAINPVSAAAWRAMSEEYADDDRWLVSRIASEWIRSSGPIPLTARKVLRISDDDIPDLYKDSKFRYLFAIPTTEKSPYGG